MDIGTIRERVRAGNYFVKSHAVQHAIKEGFDRVHDFVTAYLPDETWEIPPFRRRRARRN